MANPIFNMMNNQPIMNNVSELSRLYKMFSNGGNPMNIFMQMAQKDQRLMPIVQMLQSGGNPEQIARQLMAQRGINPEEFLNAIRNG